MSVPIAVYGWMCLSIHMVLSINILNEYSSTVFYWFFLIVDSLMLRYYCPNFSCLLSLIAWREMWCMYYLSFFYCEYCYSELFHMKGCECQAVLLWASLVRWRERYCLILGLVLTPCWCLKNLYKVTLRSPFVYSLGDFCGVVHCPFVLLCSFNVYWSYFVLTLLLMIVPHLLIERKMVLLWRVYDCGLMMDDLYRMNC